MGALPVFTLNPYAAVYFSPLVCLQVIAMIVGLLVMLLVCLHAYETYRHVRDIVEPMLEELEALNGRTIAEGME